MSVSSREGMTTSRRAWWGTPSGIKAFRLLGASGSSPDTLKPCNADAMLAFSVKEFSVLNLSEVMLLLLSLEKVESSKL